MFSLLNWGYNLFLLHKRKTNSSWLLWFTPLWRLKPYTHQPNLKWTSHLHLPLRNCTFHHIKTRDQHRLFPIFKLVPQKNLYFQIFFCLCASSRLICSYKNSIPLRWKNLHLTDSGCRIGGTDGELPFLALPWRIVTSFPPEKSAFKFHWGFFFFQFCDVDKVARISAFFFLKFLEYVHSLGSSTLISSKWRLSLWTSRFSGNPFYFCDLQEHTV